LSGKSYSGWLNAPGLLIVRLLVDDDPGSQREKLESPAGSVFVALKLERSESRIDQAE
jgi:hypothetical protein